MKKKNIILMIIVILIFITLFFRNIIGACIFHSEKINKNEFSTMLKSRFNPDKTVEIEANGKKYIIPLPNGAAKYISETYPGEYQYLVPAGRITLYTNITLPLNGWKNYDIYGDEYVLTNSNCKDRMEIYQESFTKFYSRITFKIFSNRN